LFWRRWHGWPRWTILLAIKKHSTSKFNPGFCKALQFVYQGLIYSQRLVMSALSNVLLSYYNSGKMYESVYCVLLTHRKQLWFLNHSTEVYFHKRNQLHIDTTAHRLYFVMKCCSQFNEIWCWVDWWTFSICMWRT
jgi:hypothetical protein